MFTFHSTTLPFRLLYYPCRKPRRAPCRFSLLLFRQGVRRGVGQGCQYFFPCYMFCFKAKQKSMTPENSNIEIINPKRV